MTQEATAASTATTAAGGEGRGLIRRAFATRGGSGDANGSGAPSSGRLRATVAALALAATLLLTFSGPASAAPPTVGATVVSNVLGGSAHLSAELKPNNFFTQWGFQYSTDNGVTWSPFGFGQGFVEANSGSRVHEYDLQGLSASTHYKVRLGALSIEGLGSSTFYPGPEAEFATADVASPSVIATDNASEVAYTTATATGKVKRPDPIAPDPSSDPAIDLNCHFEVIADAQFLDNLTNSRPGFEGATPVDCEPSNPVKTAGESEVTAHLNGLTPSTTYHLRLITTNAGGSDAKEAPSTFTTLTVDPPSVKSIENASEVEYTQAEVEGVVERPANADPAFDVTCNFEYVSDAQFKENEEVLSQPGFSGAGQVACEPIAEPAENPIHVEGESPVKAKLTGLTPSTNYHLRLSATNQGGTDSKAAAATFATQGPVPTPAVVATEDAAEVNLHTARVEGLVERPAGIDPGLNVNCRFEYVTDAQFNETGFAGASSVDCTENPISESGTAKQVSAQLGGLRAGTTFHLRLAAENGGGRLTRDAAHPFTTLPADLPTVTIDPVEGGTYTTAHVTGAVDNDDVGHPLVVAVIEISTDGGKTWSDYLSGVQLPNSFGPGVHVVEKNLTGLQPNSTYTFRIAATYSTAFPPETEANGEMAYSPEPSPSITTEPLAAPTATINPPSSITGTSAHLSGAVDPHAPAGSLNPAGKQAFATHWEFVCVPECKNANGDTIEGTVQGEDGEQPVSGDVKRLEPGTEYKVSLVVHSEGGGETKEETFPTEVLPPSVHSTLGAPDGEGGYTLQGLVNPNNHTIASCRFEWGPTAPKYAFSATCSPTPQSGTSKAVTVEAHLASLNPDVQYHSLLVVTYDSGTEAKAVDQEFKATRRSTDTCPDNEQIRDENNSLQLLECRAYEMVSPAVGKEGFGAAFADYAADGDRVLYRSGAANIVKSGQGSTDNVYVANRGVAGWQTIPDLNGSSGSIYDVPSEVDSFGVTPTAYSPDLLSSIWTIHRPGDPGTRSDQVPYLRSPDGTFVRIGITLGPQSNPPFGYSNDLTHIAYNGDSFATAPGGYRYGPGVYEFVGTGNGLPHRVDLDNFDEPATECAFESGSGVVIVAKGKTVSRDGRVIIFSIAGGCGGANPPADELWARVNGTTSFDLSASQCERSPADPGGICNGPVGSGGCTHPPNVGGEEPVGPGCRGAHFQATAPDGSRVFFTTTQQLLDSDTDQTNDIYACDLPSGSPTKVGKVNDCPELMQISGAVSGAAVESVVGVSDDGSTVYFTAKGVLAANKDALGEEAVAGDHNLYVWRSDTTHPTGQTTFIARLSSASTSGPGGERPQVTPDGRYLVLNSASQLVPTDTDKAFDVYRYDADSSQLIRVSTNIFGVAGNADGLDARISSSAVSDDGQKILFTTSEPLSPADGNGEPDLYLWSGGRVSLITTGAAGGGAGSGGIDGSGRDIYFATSQPLTPADGDDSADVYDARAGGGFSFAQAEPCSGAAGDCQSHSSNPAPTPAPESERAAGKGNVVPKHCPKGKVLRKGRCVKRQGKKHPGKKHHSKKASHSRGGGK